MAVKSRLLRVTWLKTIEDMRAYADYIRSMAETSLSHTSHN